MGIKNRGKENVGDGNSTSASDRSSDPRSSMLGAIKCRGLQDDANLDTMSTGEPDPRSSMLGAIKSGKTSDVSSDPRSSMLNAIKMSSERKLANLDHDTKITRNVSLIEIPTARSSLLATIRNRLKENKGKSCTKSAILGVMTGRDSEPDEKEVVKGKKINKGDDPFEKMLDAMFKWYSIETEDDNIQDEVLERNDAQSRDHEILGGSESK